MLRAVRRPRPDRLVTATRRGSSTRSVVAKGAPRPEGSKSSEWLSGRRQRPLVRGLILGSAPPSAWSTGVEKVSRIGLAGATRVPGAGSVTATDNRDGGNELTATGGPSRSQERAHRDTAVVPRA